jgi:hypothetical protein
MADSQRALQQDGFVTLRAVYSREQAAAVLEHLHAALERDVGGNTLRSEDGSIYGARNLLQLWPPVMDVWRRPPLPELLRRELGPDFGLVRVLYFDKPPEQSWALPWHRDLTIAVRRNRLASALFGKPTCKAGVPHVEAPRSLLDRMLTVRLHLDDVTDENGPLKVMPGSHRSDSDSAAAPVTILAALGDVLVMRPLLSHCSNKSIPGTRRQRRVLHLEFAGVAQLPDGYEWHDYIRPAAAGVGVPASPP